MPEDKVFAVGLLTKTHLEMLKDCLPEVFPVPQDDSFRKLLAALDKVERTRKRG